MNNSLENAKVGDKLIVTNRWNKQLLTVEKVQKNFVITKNYKFRKRDGSLVGHSWSMSTAKLATQEEIDAFRKAQNHRVLANKCRDINFESLSDAQLEQILEIASQKQ